MRPAKKFRGQRRYYRRIHRQAASFTLGVAPDHWYDYWHQHLDWKGFSNLGEKHRRSHLQALLQLYENILQQAQRYPHPYQSWLLVAGNDGSQDAVYFHTPNPNETAFPDKLEYVAWGIEVPPLLQRALGFGRWEVGMADERGEQNIFVRDKERWQRLT